MKSCPTCNRTYADDAYTFCLDDGTLLSAAHDQQSTLQLPAGRVTEPPSTEILPHVYTPAGPPQTLRQAAAPAPVPFNQRREALADVPPRRQGSRARLVVGGVIALLTIAVLVLGYLLLRNNQDSSSVAEKSGSNVQANIATATPTPRTNTNASTNTSPSATPTPIAEASPLWLEGVWEGTGRQDTPKMTWTVKLTAENNTYTIDYPSLRCGGKWTLVEASAGRAKFKETITRGLDRCSSDGVILVEKTSDRQISYKYTLPIIGEVATATLTRKDSRQ